ncbi:MAG: hypothetical protein ACOCZ5_01810 [bacterium]
MTLQELKDYFEKICLSHREINEFYTGNDYNQAEQITHKYPLIFYELPYFINYSFDPNRLVDEVQFSFNVFVQSNFDNIDNDHNAISKAKEIGDAIITYINQTAKHFVFIRADATSVREFTDDSVAGMRFETTILLPREICESSNWVKLFNFN